MFDKDVPGFVRYRCWRRTLPGGKTEYKSVTTAPDVTPQEVMDIYLDDAFRRNWVRPAPLGFGVLGGVGVTTHWGGAQAGKQTCTRTRSRTLHPPPT